MKNNTPLNSFEAELFSDIRGASSGLTFAELRFLNGTPHDLTESAVSNLRRQNLVEIVSQGDLELIKVR